MSHNWRIILGNVLTGGGVLLLVAGAWLLGMPWGLMMGGTLSVGVGVGLTLGGTGR